MNFRPLFVLLLVTLFAITSGFSGCASSSKKPKIQKPSGPDMTDQSGDTSFQAFQGRLRKAASKRDLPVLASMMIADFHYGWGPGEEGAGVFEYWNQHNLWRELELVLREKFVPSGDYMVAPAAVTYDPDYKGYRAGLQLVNGAWRFAYFVSAPPASEVQR